MLIERWRNKICLDWLNGSPDKEAQKVDIGKLPKTRMFRSKDLLREHFDERALPH